MSTWPKDELKRIGETDDLHIAPFRDDGKTYGTLTWIWSVVVDEDLYVRAYNGKNSRWYRAAVRQKAGRNHGRGHDEGSHVRTSGRDHSRSHRCSLSVEIQGQSPSQSDDHRRRAERDDEGDAEVSGKRPGRPTALFQGASS